MTFPGYTPDAVRQYITTLLYGDGHGFKGWAAAANGPGNKWITSVVDFLHRFEQQDERINTMFHHLDGAGLDEQKQKSFVNATWLALNDYEKYRDLLKRAEEQRKAIAKQAEELANLLRDITKHGVLADLPTEFFAIRTLLRKTDGDDQLWPLMRERLSLVPGDPEANGLDYIWGIAPKVSDLLDTVAKAARDYQPKIIGRIGAAISKDQRSPRTEFIRAFGQELIEAGIPLSESSVPLSMTANVRPRRKNTPAQSVAYDIRMAMAAVATVALGNTIREREIAQQFPDIKPLTRPQQSARVIRFD